MTRREHALWILAALLPGILGSIIVTIVLTNEGA